MSGFKSCRRGGFILTMLTKKESYSQRNAQRISPGWDLVMHGVLIFYWAFGWMWLGCSIRVEFEKRSLVKPPCKTDGKYFEVTLYKVTPLFGRSEKGCGSPTIVVRCHSCHKWDTGHLIKPPTTIPLPRVNRQCFP